MNIPKEFISEIESYNDKSLDGLVEALADTDASVSVRANRGKQVSMPANVDYIPWCGHGWYLPQREAFTFDPAMHQGLYYGQVLAKCYRQSHVDAQRTLSQAPCSTAIRHQALYGTSLRPNMEHRPQ